MRRVKVFADGVWVETDEGVYQLSRHQLEVLRWIYDSPLGPWSHASREHFYQAVFGLPKRWDRKWKKRRATAAQRASMSRTLRRLEERGLLIRTERDSVYGAVDATPAGKALVAELGAHGSWESLFGTESQAETRGKG